MESKTGGAPILSLPTELTVSVFRKLKLRSLLRCAQVCLRWNMLVRDTDELQYQIELEVHEVQDNCPGNMSIPRRLQLLRHKQTAWRTGMGGDILSVMKMSDSAPFTWRFSGDSIVYVDQSERKVCYKPFGPGSLSARVNIWPLPDVGNYATLSFDPDQDLIAIASLVPIEHKMHVCILLRSVTTGEAHSLAVGSGELRASLTFQIGAIEIPGFCILGDIISISTLGFDYDNANAFGSDTVVWNWKSGVLQKRIRGMRTNLMLMTDDLGMIWDTNISTTNGHAPGLAIHDLQKRNTPSEGCLAGSNYDYALLVPSFLFDFPSTGRHEVQLHSPRSRRQSSVFPPAPNADNLINIDMRGFNESVGMQTRRLLVSQSKLMAKLQEKPENSQQLVLPWDDWKSCVVWASEESQREPLEPQTTAGMRYVEQSSAVHSGSVLNVLDFNPRRVARAASTGVHPGESLKVFSRTVVTV